MSTRSICLLFVSVLVFSNHPALASSQEPEFSKKDVSLIYGFLIQDSYLKEIELVSDQKKQIEQELSTLKFDMSKALTP